MNVNSKKLESLVIHFRTNSVVGTDAFAPVIVHEFYV